MVQSGSIGIVINPRTESHPLERVDDTRSGLMRHSSTKR